MDASKFDGEQVPFLALVSPNISWTHRTEPFAKDYLSLFSNYSGQQLSKRLLLWEASSLLHILQLDI